MESGFGLESYARTVVSELPVRSVWAKDDFCDIHWSMQPPG